MLKIKMKKRMAPILAALLVIAVMIAFTPQMAAPAYATSGDPAIVLDTDVLKNTQNTANAQTVYMAGNAWKVIGYNGQGVASASNTREQGNQRYRQVNSVGSSHR